MMSQYIITVAKTKCKEMGEIKRTRQEYEPWPTGTLLKLSTNKAICFFRFSNRSGCSSQILK